MLENFVEIEYVLSFAGMVIIVTLITQAIKKLVDGVMPKNRTKYVALAVSIFLCIFAAWWKGNWSSVEEVAQTIVIWFINCIIVWFSAMKTYESVRNNRTKEP